MWMIYGRIYSLNPMILTLILIGRYADADEKRLIGGTESSLNTADVSMPHFFFKKETNPNPKP